jgi:hypothetical protein
MARRRRPGRSSRSSASPFDRVTSVARDVLAGKVAARSHPRSPATCPAPRGGHPSLGHGDPGVARDGGSDPGHS